ncbi:TonB-dependent receptor [Lysobacteraceae bacterium NML95-0200]|nr:TonB-dependent receptor [Xanthomonadaceae bacterium NML95-0200]
MRKTVLGHAIFSALTLTPALACAQAASTEATASQPLDKITVTGSRIPRTQVEGPAAITAISAEQIQASGFTSVPELLRSLTQNGGETQGQQSSMGAATTPGAQQVSLRGLGANHTLILINGRRVADFPLPLQGRSNFTDVGNIPLGMIERVEVLTGSASAIYGSDAMAGVINLILKKSADGTHIDYRYGNSSRGGGQSQRLTLTSGFERNAFSAVFGLEVQNKKPLWSTRRSIQNSTLNAPDADSRLPRLIAEIYDDDAGENIAPGDACAAMGHLNEGTTTLANGDYGAYCGSERAIAYNTIEQQRKGINAYAAMRYQFSENLDWFADLQWGRHKVALLNTPTRWAFQDPASTRNYANVFYNAHSGRYEAWWRQFAPEEMGGIRRAMNRNTQKTLAVATGLEGTWGEDWQWQAALNHAQYKADVRFARIHAEAANRLFLGERQGYDSDGYAIYNTDPERLFRPLSVAEYDAIAATSTFRPKAQTDTLSLTVNNPALFSMPAGDAGFAGVLEYGRQSYAIHPDPVALTTGYYGARYGDGSGKRNHWSVAGEARIPLLARLDASLAGRYDRYRYAGNQPGKFTYHLGLEWRPLDSLLLRSSYGTGFRAPDLHYLFAGEDYFRTRATDHYRCRLANPDAPIANCRSSLRRARVTNIRTGNPALDVETSTSLTAGIVWSPTADFDISLDYYRIRIRNQVQDFSIDALLRQEADCRLGQTPGGSPVDATSPSCVDAIARVMRDGATLTGVRFNPINISREETSGFDLASHYRLRTENAGDFRFRASYSWVHKHTSQQYPGDPIENQLAVDTGYYIPRSKANIGLAWEKGPMGLNLYGHRLGRISNYDNNAWTPATWRLNAGAHYDISPQLGIALSVNNLQDKMPPRDATYSSYPYYDISWYDAVGRSYWLQLSWKIGKQ